MRGPWTDLVVERCDLCEGQNGTDWLHGATSRLQPAKVTTQQPWMLVFSPGTPSPPPPPPPIPPTRGMGPWEGGWDLDWWWSDLSVWRREWPSLMLVWSADLSQVLSLHLDNVRHDATLWHWLSGNQRLMGYDTNTEYYRLTPIRVHKLESIVSSVSTYKGSERALCFWSFMLEPRTLEGLDIGQKRKWRVGVYDQDLSFSSRNKKIQCFLF